ncbi:unnamed protein product, partial [Musa acuminata subsp. burmannicoides]
MPQLVAFPVTLPASLHHPPLASCVRSKATTRWTHKCCTTNVMKVNSHHDSSAVLTVIKKKKKKKKK